MVHGGLAIRVHQCCDRWQSVPISVLIQDDADGDEEEAVDKEGCGGGVEGSIGSIL